jgi:glycosyltransferase involved in cell wall biosynthesis
MSGYISTSISHEKINMHTLPLSAIIVAKNGAGTLADCLESVRRNNPAEIIIIDGMSSDGTLGIARAYTQRIFSDEGRGVSFAHQLGLEQARQPHIAYIDADIILPDNALETMLEELQTGGFANMQARLDPVKSQTYWEKAQDWHMKSSQLRTRGGLSAAILDKGIAAKIGFDPEIRIAGDDVDFLYRLKKAGYKIGTSPVSVTHVHREGLRGLARQRFWYGRAKPPLIKKHGPWKAGLWAPLVSCYWLAMAAIKFRFDLIPYFLVIGLADTAGMIKGSFELLQVKSA